MALTGATISRQVGSSSMLAMFRSMTTSAVASGVERLEGVQPPASTDHLVDHGLIDAARVPRRAVPISQIHGSEGTPASQLRTGEGQRRRARGRSDDWRDAGDGERDERLGRRGERAAAGGPGR